MFMTNVLVELIFMISTLVLAELIFIIRGTKHFSYPDFSLSKHDQNLLHFMVNLHHYIIVAFCFVNQILEHEQSEQKQICNTTALLHKCYLSPPCVSPVQNNSRVTTQLL